MTASPLFDKILWRDPVGGGALEPIVGARTPAGVPLFGALRISGTPYGYPIVDCVARLTPELARRHAEWLAPHGLQPPPLADGAGVSFQPEETVDSFGFQWSWNSAMRSEADLRWRVADRFKFNPENFAGKTVLDAGSGAGDQSRWMLERGAAVVSIDLSGAIEVVSRKLRMNSNWFGVQGDITALPFTGDFFDAVYCEGVIQHTRDSALTVRELCRALNHGGTILATHYTRPVYKSWQLISRMRAAWFHYLRGKLSRWERYKLLWFTGTLAAFSYVPLFGWMLKKIVVIPYYKLMPDFKTTWTNTFDLYGGHSYQRYFTAEEFWKCFEALGDIERVYQEGTIVAARKK